MYDSKRIVIAILVVVVAIVLVDAAVARLGPLIHANEMVSSVIAFGLLAYIVVMIAARGRIRVPSMPRRKPRRLRVVKRDPSSAAADFIKQFEDRSRR